MFKRVNGRERRSLLVWGLVAALIALSGCGGSASESPWPPEPNDVDLGPSGEQEALQPERAPVKAPASSAQPPSAKPAGAPH